VRGRLIARSGPPPPLWVRLRRRLERAPKLSGDHSLDWTAEDIINPWPQRIELSPGLVRLAASLRGMSPERRQVLAESESGNGFHGWWAPHIERAGSWQAFRAMSLEALSNYHEHSIPVENTLAVYEQDRDAA
jgi:hypothetical protein